MTDPTYNEQEAQDYLLGDRSARPGATNIGIGLALLALVEEVRAIRESMQARQSHSAQQFLEREVVRLQEEVRLEQQRRVEAEARGGET